MAAMKQLSFCVIFGLTFFAFSTSSQAQNTSFEVWVTQFEQEAIANGISPEIARATIDHATLDDRVIELDQKQPETTISFDAYSDHILNPKRIEQGRALLQEHAKILSEISYHYGVPSQIIVALWGIESDYGHNSGGFNVIDALTTLAYEGRRSEFFRSELMNALRIIDTDHVSTELMRGSWAGAMGQCQFMPSTYLHYAVDYDGQGIRDIWDNEADIFASIANYIVAEGWRSDLNWGREVNTKYAISSTEVGLDHQHSLAEWSHLGVVNLNGKPLLETAQQASLIQPDGPDGRSFLVYDSFRALMRWNHSTYFAASVGLLADKIRVSQ